MVVQCARKSSEWRNFCIGSVIRLYVMSYVSYLIARRVEIFKSLRNCEKNNCTEINVADSKANLTHKAVLRMFRDDSDILDNNVVIGVFSALLFFYVVAEVFSILMMCGFFMKKSGKKKKKKEEKHTYERGENIAVRIEDRYCKGTIHAQNANDTLDVVFSDRDVYQLEAGIEASGSVTELVDLSEHITNVTSSEIKACNADLTRLKNLLYKRLRIRELTADKVEAISDLGMYKKMQLKFPVPFKVLKTITKLYRTYRYPLMPLFSQTLESIFQLMGFFAMTGGTAQLPSVLIWGLLIVVDNILSPWLIFHWNGKMLEVVMPMVSLFFSISYSLIPLLSYLTWRYGSGIFTQPPPRASDAQPDELFDQFIGFANEGYMYGVEIYIALARAVALESFITTPTRLLSTCWPLLNILLTLYSSDKRFDKATSRVLKMHSVRVVQVHPAAEGAAGMTQSKSDREDSTRETSTAVTKANLAKDNVVAQLAQNNSPIAAREKKSSDEGEVHACLRTPTARKVLTAIKFGYPSMLSIGSLALLGLILHGVLRPVCVDKVWDGCLARTYPLLNHQSKCPCVIFVAGGRVDEPGQGLKRCDSDLQCAEWEYCAASVSGFGLRESDYKGQCIPNPCPKDSDFPFSCTDELHIGGKCSARRPVPWDKEELKALCDNSKNPTTKKTAEELGRTINTFIDKKFEVCSTGDHSSCGEGRYCRSGGFCPQPKGNMWMNTKKYDNKPFDVDTKKCREKCDMNEDKLCKKQDFLLHNFCNDIRDDECKRERDYCSCWRLALQPRSPDGGGWGPGRCHSCETCKHLNDCPDWCDPGEFKPLKPLKTVSTTFSELWEAMEHHASETLIAFVVKYAPFEGESKLDLRKMVRLHTFALAHINEGTAIESGVPQSTTASTAANSLTLQVSTPITGCTTGDDICARKLTYFAIVGKKLFLDFNSKQECGKSTGDTDLERVWLQDAEIANNWLPDNLVCGDARKKVKNFRLRNLDDLNLNVSFSREWESLEYLEFKRINLNSIPSGVGELPNLRTLIVKGRTSSTLKTWLPGTLSSLTHLHKLHLELGKTRTTSNQKGSKNINKQDSDGGESPTASNKKGNEKGGKQDSDGSKSSTASNKKGNEKGGKKDSDGGASPTANNQKGSKNIGKQDSDGGESPTANSKKGNEKGGKKDSDGSKSSTANNQKGNEEGSEGNDSENVLDDTLFSGMTVLKQLTLRLNLPKLPRSICDLKELRRASFVSNPISELPSCLTELSELFNLDVSDTALTQLPDFIDEFANLRELDVERTTLSTIPYGLSALNLTTFGLTGVRGLLVPEGHPICVARKKYRVLTGDQNAVVCMIFGDNIFLFDCQAPKEACICGTPISDNKNQNICGDTNTEQSASASQGKKSSQTQGRTVSTGTREATFTKAKQQSSKSTVARSQTTKRIISSGAQSDRGKRKKRP